MTPQEALFYLLNDYQDSRRTEAAKVLQGAIPTLSIGGDGKTTLLGPSGSLNIQNIRDRFFASLPNGENYRMQKSLLATPAWQASTGYKTGAVVQNGGNIYLCQNSDGISAGAGGPSGTGAAPIVDNTVKWLYMGAADSALSDTSDAPTVTFAGTHASTTRRYDPTIAADAAAFWFSGANYANAVPWGGGNAIQGVGYNHAFAVDFCTDAPIVSFNSHANASKPGVNFLINGTPMYKIGGVRHTGDVTPGGVILDFSSKPRKVRRLRAYLGNGTFTGVSVDPKYSVWKPHNPHRYRLVVEGDSTTQGAAPTDSFGGQYRSHRLASMLGCDDVWCTAVGSTGFLNAGGGSTVLSRAATVIAAAPDILYVPPIYNDRGNGGAMTTAARKAAYKQYFDTILAALPNCIIICGGGYEAGADNLSTAATTSYQVEMDMAAAITEYNHPHVKFLPSISDVSGRWLYGDGHVGSAGSVVGNAALMIGDGSDTLHPNQRYLEYVMWREYYGIVNIMNNLS